MNSSTASNLGKVMYMFECFYFLFYNLQGSCCFADLHTAVVQT